MLAVITKLCITSQEFIYLITGSLRIPTRVFPFSLAPAPGIHHSTVSMNSAFFFFFWSHMHKHDHTHLSFFVQFFHLAYCPHCKCHCMSLQMSEFPSFCGLNNIPLYICIFFTHSSVDGHLTLFIGYFEKSYSEHRGANNSLSSWFCFLQIYTQSRDFQIIW